jgi:hypothetical protein
MIDGGSHSYNVLAHALGARRTLGFRSLVCDAHHRVDDLRDNEY